MSVKPFPEFIVLDAPKFPENPENKLKKPKSPGKRLQVTRQKQGDFIHPSGAFTGLNFQDFFRTVQPLSERAQLVQGR
jgi:hypothetical protein